MITFFELREKVLTSAEKRKREQVAKALERENPNMPMAKKMAIATATAKKVAEDSEPVNEISQKLKDRYVQRSQSHWQHMSAVARDSGTDQATKDKLRAKMKKRNQGMARAFGQTKDNW